MCDIIFGAAFIAAGLFILITFILLHFPVYTWLFCTIFILVGSGELYAHVVRVLHIKDIVARGIRYTGRITDYADGIGVIVNGVPPLDLIIEVQVDGGPCPFRVASGGYSEYKFPIGATVDIAVLDGEAAMVPGSVRL